MASLAQQESESLSQNVKLGMQYRYQQGLVQVKHNRFLGYTKDEEGQLIIEPEEAEVVKRIYREYLEGASLAQIGKSLEADSILTAAGKSKWRPETLKKILQNEKYIESPSCRKPIQWIFFQRSGSGTMALYRSIMWRTATSQSFPVTFICRFRRRWHGGQISTAEQKGRSGSIAASMLCQALFTAPNAGIFTAGLHGITGGNILRSGGVAPVWSMGRRNVMHRPFRNRICRMRW